jgi:hypothetical protein
MDPRLRLRRPPASRLRREHRRHPRLHRPRPGRQHLGHRDGLPPLPQHRRHHHPPPATTSRRNLLGGWNTTPHWTLTYTSPEDDAPAPYGVVRGDIHVDVYVDAPNTDGWHDTTDRYSNVRFDSTGRAAGKTIGTVFPDAKVTVPFSLNPAAGFPASARHYDDALHHTVTTFPSNIGKNVPGETRPLHRTLNGQTQTDNSNAAKKTCNDVWGTYPENLLNCDEYPFASTQEGAAFGDETYSARVLDANDNQAAGRQLNSVYTLNRVIDGDAFYITITP